MKATFWQKIQSGEILHDVMEAIKPKQEACRIAMGVAEVADAPLGHNRSALT